MAVKVVVLVLFALSLAVTVIMLSPLLRLRLTIDQLVVPLAVPDPPLLLAQVTEVTPTLSEAVPERLMVEAVEA